MKTWLLRVASRPEDGGGHMARCLALAQVLAANGPVVFALDRNAQVWHALIRDRGFAVCTEGEEPARDYQGAIVDLYHEPEKRIECYRRLCGWVAALDDFGRPPAADLAIHPAADASGDMIGTIPALCGPRYALLSPDYAAASPRAVCDDVAGVFVGFGLRDSNDATGLTLAALERLRNAGARFAIDVALGAAAPHRAAVAARCAALGARLHIDAADLRPLLAAADLAVGAGGVSLYERMAAGLPSIAIAIADNQQAAIAGLAAAGAVIDAGPVSALNPETLATIIDAAMGDADRRRTLSTRGRALVDGQGAARVAAAVIARSARTGAPVSQVTCSIS